MSDKVVKEFLELGGKIVIRKEKGIITVVTETAIEIEKVIEILTKEKENAKTKKM